MPATNTYAYGTFADDDVELARLERQAAVDPALEVGMLRAFGLAPGQRALDVGCGPGVITAELAAVVAEDGHEGTVVGVDVNDDLLAVAARNTRGLAHVHLRRHDMARAPVPAVHGAPFDFAYARFVFQHLADPLVVARHVLGSLRPGATCCVVDVDDDWFACWPEGAAVTELFATARSMQGAFGGDRLVGRKLAGILAKAGFAQVQAGVHTVTSTDVGLAVLLDLATGYKASFAESRGVAVDRHALRRDVEALSSDPAASAALGLFWAVGTVPSDVRTVP